MKVLIDNYTFNKTSKQITLTDYTSIEQERLLLITNTTSNVIIYNFANPSLGCTVLNNVITLSYDTSAMSNTDKLQIFYEDVKSNASDELVELLRDQLENDETLRKQLLQLLKPLGIVHSSTGKVSVDLTGTTVTVAQPTYASLNANVGAVVNQTNIGGLNALDMQFNMAHTAWNTGMRANITF